jgi:hypothetical protein
MAWTNTTKDWDYARPFHRINSPSWNPSAGRVDGRGYLRGCHAPSDGPNDSVYGLIIRRIARAIPGWVTVSGEREQEVEGKLDRCFQTWTDVPLLQWHRYYDWNFHVAPAEGYAYVRGMGNEESGRSELAGTQRRVTASDTMECEWDCGAFGPRPGAMFNNAQWIWPMTGQYCWISGRWIYDCGHASSDDKSGSNEGLMRSEIHPCKAMASAQWEAVKFPENGGLYVPGIRFQFFASKLGGYKNFNALNDRDYEFIVDLPRHRGVSATWRIGHTPDFPLNTAVLRSSHLLHQADFITTATGTPGSVQPIVEPLPAAAPGDLPEQVKVTIPLTQLSPAETYYGVILKLGWYDPDQSQARRVKRCVVKFKHIHKGDEDHDTFAEEWLVKFGVNGRWFLREFNGVHNDTNLQLNLAPQEFYLADTDSIYVTAHGAELDLVDNVFHHSDSNRTVRLHGTVQDWERDIAHSSGQKLRDLCYEVADMMASTFNDQNDPLGIIDPLGSAQRARGGTADNPLPVAALDFTNAPHSQIAFFTEEVGESAELAEDRTRIDYVLHYEVTVQPQLA